MQPTLKEILQERIRRALSSFFSTQATSLTASSLRSLIKDNVTDEEVKLSHTRGDQLRDLVPRHALSVLESYQTELTLSELFQEPIAGQSTPSTSTKEVVGLGKAPPEQANSPEMKAILILAQYLKLDIRNDEVRNRKLDVPSTEEQDENLKDVRQGNKPKTSILYQGKKVYLPDISNQAKKHGINTITIRSTITARITQSKKNGIFSKEVLLQILLKYITERNQELSSFFKIPLCSFLSQEETELMGGTESFEEQQGKGLFNINTIDMRLWTLEELEDRKHLYLRPDLEEKIQLLCYRERKEHKYLRQIEEEIKNSQASHLQDLDNSEDDLNTEEEFLDFLNQSLTPENTAIIRANAQRYLAGRFVIPELQTKPWMDRLKFNSNGLFALSPYQDEENKASAASTISKCKSNILNVRPKSRHEAFSSLQSLCDFLNNTIPIKLRRSLYTHNIPTESIITKTEQELAKKICVRKITIEGRDYFLFSTDQQAQTQTTQQQSDTLESPPHKKRKKDHHADDNTRETSNFLLTTSIPAAIQISVIQAPHSSQQQAQESTHQPPTPPFFIPHQELPESRSEKLRQAIEEEARAYRDMQIAQQVSQITRLFQAQQQEKAVEHSLIETTALPRPRTPIQEPYQYTPWQQHSHYPSFVSVVDGTTAPTTTTQEELTAAEALLSLSQDTSLNREQILGELSQQPQTSGIDTVDNSRTESIEHPRKKFMKQWKKENDNDQDDTDRS